MIQSAPFPNVLNPASASEDPPQTSIHQLHHIYEQYFTADEIRLLQTLPTNDVTSEIQLLRILLARSFAQVPAGPTDARQPLALKSQYGLCTLFSRVVLVIAAMVALHLKQHPPQNMMFQTVMEMIHQVHEEQGLV
jgi:hypothetical protein